LPDTFVVDTSVAAKWILNEPGHGEALEWLERSVQGEISLLSPDLLLLEFASLISKRNRRKQMTDGQAREAYEMMVRFAPRLVETQPRLELALELSLSNALSLWDCVFLAVAIEHQCALITADSRFYRGVLGHYSKVMLLTGLP
jgi:predicted nucleic acid-binding protein